MIYFSSAPVRPESVDAEQYRALVEFRKDCEQRGLVETFDTSDEFRRKLSRQLAATINDHEYFKRESLEGSLPNNDRPAATNVSKEAAELLVEGSKDKQGAIMRVHHSGGVNVSTNGRDFVPHNSSARLRALREGAVDELESKDLIKDIGHQREVYQLTRAGYELADVLREE